MYYLSASLQHCMPYYKRSRHIISILSLACTCLVLAGCSTQQGTRSRAPTYCQQLQHEMIANDAAAGQPGVDGSPLTKALLMQRYRDNQCPALETETLSKQAQQSKTSEAAAKQTTNSKRPSKYPSHKKHPSSP